jgi:DNA processing protein
VVAPAGFGVAYPAANRDLFARIVASGSAYVSLVPDSARATRGAFFSRNACLAALAHALVVVEADFQSGARNAASWARRIGRPLLAVPYAPWQPRGRGCLLELRAGARMCRGVADVLEELENRLTGPGLVAPEDPAPEQAVLPFYAGSPESRVRGAVERGARTPDEIGAASGLDAAAVQRHVLTLTLEGVLAPDAAGGLTLAPRRALVSPRKQRK